MMTQPVAILISLCFGGLLLAGCGSSSSGGSPGSATTETVVLTESSKARPCASTEAIAPPWVVGQTVRIATKRLRDSGFDVRVVPLRTSQPRRPGIVMRQAPPRNFHACKGAPISLFVPAGT
jgi:beta-lactam-binding protein with PASTA domain